MKTIVLIVMVFMYGAGYSQPIPADSMYLGQVPPGNTPKVFNLPKSPGSFTAERIAISNDGKEIFFSVIRYYYPTSGDTVKYFNYNDNKWNGPFSLFSNHLAPALSLSGDTMYIQNNSMIYQTLLSYRTANGWSNPRRILYSLNNAHYLQVTNSGNYYISSVSSTGLGATDWCRLYMNNSDSVAVSLRLPLNNYIDNLDFFISRDESFIIIAKNTGSNAKLNISYKKNDGSWTNPKNLGPAINSGLAAWGPYVSPDGKYLFYTTGTNPNYSDTYVYWVRIDGIADSLKHTNFVPYLKNQIPNITDTTGKQFSYTIPDSVFIDDDGNNTLTYSAVLSSGLQLPSWLSFNSITRTFSSSSLQTGSLNIRVTAADTANAVAVCIFTINVLPPIGLEPVNENLPAEYFLYQNFPNPFNPITEIKFDIPKTSFTKLILYDAAGRETGILVSEILKAGKYKLSVNADKLSSGVYFYRLETGNFVQTRKMIVLK
jgi:hypothetical protein